MEHTELSSSVLPFSLQSMSESVGSAVCLALSVLLASSAALTVALILMRAESDTTEPVRGASLSVQSPGSLGAEAPMALAAGFSVLSFGVPPARASESAGRVAVEFSRFSGLEVPGASGV